MWLQEEVPQPTLQLQESSHGMRRGVQLQATWQQLTEHS